MFEVMLLYGSSMLEVRLLYGSSMLEVRLLYGSSMLEVRLLYSSSMLEVRLLYSFSNHMQCPWSYTQYTGILNTLMTTFHPSIDCYPPLKDFVGILFCRCPSVRSLSVSTSFRPSRFSVRTHILVMDFQILLSPAEDFEGDIVLALSVRPAMDYGKLTIGAL